MSHEQTPEDWGDHFIDGKWIPDSDLTPDQRERVAKQDWAFRLGYDHVDLGVKLTDGDKAALENAELQEHFVRGKTTAMSDKRFINPSSN